MKLRAPRLPALLLTCLAVALWLPEPSAPAQDTPPPLGEPTPAATPDVPIIVQKRGAKGKAAVDATPKPTRIKKPKEFSFPLPIGDTAHGLKLPQLDALGKLMSQLDTLSATHIDNEHVLLHEAKIDLYHPDGREDFHVLLPESIFNLKTNVITSDHPVTVRTPDFELTGERMQFDTVERTGELQGHVHMVIHNFKQVAGFVPATPAP